MKKMKKARRVKPGPLSAANFLENLETAGVIMGCGQMIVSLFGWEKARALASLFWNEQIEVEKKKKKNSPLPSRDVFKFPYKG